jgi:hypothetical protein
MLPNQKTHRLSRTSAGTKADFCAHDSCSLKLPAQIWLTMPYGCARLHTWTRNTTSGQVESMQSITFIRHADFGLCISQHRGGCWPQYRAKRPDLASARADRLLATRPAHGAQHHAQLQISVLYRLDGSITHPVQRAVSGTVGWTAGRTARRGNGCSVARGRRCSRVDLLSSLRRRVDVFEDMLLPITRDGRTGPNFFTFSVSPIRDEQGVIGGVLGTVIETTEKVLALARHQEAEVRYRLSLESGHMGT